jgi:hypothetical protein
MLLCFYVSSPSYVIRRDKLGCIRKYKINNIFNYVTTIAFQMACIVLWANCAGLKKFEGVGYATGGTKREGG